MNAVQQRLKGCMPHSLREWLMLISGAIIVLAAVGVVAWIKLPPRPLSPTKQDASVSIPWLPQTVSRWSPILNEMGKKYDVDPDFLAIITTLESGGYSKAESPVIGAKGLMQVTTYTGKDIAKKYVKEPRTNYDLNDPRTNIEFGAAYLSYLRDVFGERSQAPSWDYTVELVSAGYNGGPGNAGKLYRGEGLTSSETVAYSRDALNMWRERHAQTSPTFDRWLSRGGQELIDKAKTEPNP